MKQEKIEILMAAYNGAAYIREQIDSILGQTYESWHLTISDDGSNDGTDAVIDEYARMYPDRIRRVFSGRRFGNARDHFMWLTSQCQEKWMCFSDQDDVFFAQKLEKMAALMQKTEDESGSDTPILIFSDQTPTDAQLNPLCDSLMKMQGQYTEEIDWRALIFQNVVTGGAMMINRPLAEMAGRCSDTSRIIMHDWWIAIVAARFGKAVYLNESTGYYRQHGSNSVGAKDVRGLPYIKSRLAGLSKVQASIAAKKQQALAFEQAYGEQLEQEAHAFLSRFGRKRSGLVFYYRHRKLFHGSFRLIGFAVLG